MCSRSKTERDPPLPPARPTFSKFLHQPCVYKFYNQHNQSRNFFSKELHEYNKETQNCSNHTFYDAATALSASRNNTFTSRFNWFFNDLLNTPSYFGGSPLPPPSPSPSPVKVNTMIEKTTFAAIKFAAMVIPCSMERARILFVIRVSE